MVSSIFLTQPFLVRRLQLIIVMDLASLQHRVQWSSYLLEISKILNIKNINAILSISTTDTPLGQ